MALLGTNIEVGEIVSISLELYSVVLKCECASFGLHAKFSFKRQDDIFEIDPVSRSGPIENLWGAVADVVSNVQDEGERFRITLASGAEIVCKYTNRLEHVHVGGPDPDMFEAFPK